jgi:hypothetical protein
MKLWRHKRTPIGNDAIPTISTPPMLTGEPMRDVEGQQSLRGPMEPNEREASQFGSELAETSASSVHIQVF